MLLSNSRFIATKRRLCKEHMSRFTRKYVFSLHRQYTVISCLPGEQYDLFHLLDPTFQAFSHFLQPTLFRLLSETFETELLMTRLICQRQGR